MISKIADKLFIKQWNIGLAKVNKKDFINNGHKGINCKWLPVISPTRFFADPFIFRDPAGKINVVYEDYCYHDQYGKLSVSVLDDEFSPVLTKEILDTKSHLSYPNVFIHEGKTFIIPCTVMNTILQETA